MFTLCLAVCPFKFILAPTKQYAFEKPIKKLTNVTRSNEYTEGQKIKPHQKNRISENLFFE